MADDAGERFLEACGLGGPLVLELQGPGGAEQRRAFDRPFVVVGSDPGADLVLDDPQVSRRHAYLQAIDGRLFVVDLESRTGLVWPDGPAPWGWADADRGLSIGPWRFRPVAAATTAAAAAWPAGLDRPLSSRPRVHRQLSGLALQAVGPSDEAAEWPMTNALALVGRSADCRVRLDDEAVSRHHAALLRTPSGAWAVDLLGRGGIAVNGRPARFAPLDDGDELQVAGYRLRARVAAAERPDFELVPWAAAPPALLTAMTAPAPAEVVDPALAHVIGHFGQMQQQMFDQFQQMLMMMAQWMGTLHRDQMERVRAEVDELRRLNRELSALRAANGEPAADAPAAGPGPVPDPAPEPRAEPGPRPATPGGGAVPGPELHTLLARRLAEMQREQQTRWQRVVDLVMGRA